jgi:hypothetical protein
MTRGELGWYRDDAIVVAEWLLGRGVAMIALNFGSLRTPQFSRVYKRRQELFPTDTQPTLGHRKPGNCLAIAP